MVVSFKTTLSKSFSGQHFQVTQGLLMIIWLLKTAANLDLNSTTALYVSFAWDTYANIMYSAMNYDTHTTHVILTCDNIHGSFTVHCKLERFTEHNLACEIFQNQDYMINFKNYNQNVTQRLIFLLLVISTLRRFWENGIWRVLLRVALFPALHIITIRPSVTLLCKMHTCC